MDRRATGSARSEALHQFIEGDAGSGGGFRHEAGTGEPRQGIHFQQGVIAVAGAHDVTARDVTAAAGHVRGKADLGETRGDDRVGDRNFLRVGALILGVATSNSQVSPAREVYRVEEHWNRGKRDGLFQWWDHTGKLCFSHEFQNDKLMTPQNNPTGNLLLKRIADGTLNDQELEHILLQRCDMEYHELPLKEVIEDCKERFALRLAMRSRRRTVVLTPSPMPLDDPPLPAMHEIPFSDEWTLLEPDNVREAPQLVDMRPRALARPAPPSPLPPVVKNIYEAPVSVSLSNVPLLAGFDAILSPLGLVLDYRYGVLCVVDASDAESWRDLTGVMDLHPPADTDLSDRLDAPAKVTIYTNLAGVLQNLSRDQQISVEFRMEQIAASTSATGPLTEWPGLPGEVMNFNDPHFGPLKEPLPITLRQLLGLLLDQANLHCHEENGVLIIEPPSKAAAKAETRRKP